MSRKCSITVSRTKRGNEGVWKHSSKSQWGRRRNSSVRGSCFSNFNCVSAVKWVCVCVRDVQRMLCWMNSGCFLVVGSKTGVLSQESDSVWLREGLLIVSCPVFLCLHINTHTRSRSARLRREQSRHCEQEWREKDAAAWPKRHKEGYVKKTKKRKEKRTIDAAEGTQGTDFPLC